MAVGCGRALAGERVAIVDPDRRQRLGPDRVGEIWVAGPNVAGGYWHNAEASEAVFGVRPLPTPGTPALAGGRPGAPPLSPHPSLPRMRGRVREGAGEGRAGAAGEAGRGRRRTAG